MVVGSLYLTRAFGFYRLPLLVVCFILIVVYLIRQRTIKLDIYAVAPILFVIFGSLLWSLWGVVNGNSSQAAIDALRLFFIFYILYSVMTIYASKSVVYSQVELVFCIATLLIAITSFIAIYNLDILPVSFRDSLEIRVGIYDGYIQNTSHNIGILALTVPYLLTLIIYKKSYRNFLVNITAFVGVAAILLSSRRAIYFVILVVPLIVLFLHVFSMPNPMVKLQRIVGSIAALIVAILMAIFLVYNLYPNILEGFLDRIIEAANQINNQSHNLSKRKLQADALLKGVSELPFFGSGFGGVTTIVRNDNAWVYEMSYHALLFNIGILGFCMFLLLLAIQFYRIMFLIKKYDIENKYQCIALMCGVISMYIISYSNPYISSSFDFLIINFILPFIILKEVSGVYED